MRAASHDLADIAKSYRHLSTRFDPQHGAFWLYLDTRPRPCFTFELLDELRRLEEELERSAGVVGEGPNRIRYFIAASKTPGVFNLGGDLALFARCVTENDPETLRKYARACIDVLYPYMVGFNLPITTISLVQGDALGGGFEAALGGDILVAERSAQMGFPEVLFNLFPGMGAYNLLHRRIGLQGTERMLLNGKLYRSEELPEGVVDILTEDGGGERAVYDYIVRQSPKRNAHEAILRVRRQLCPIRYEQLLEVAEIWVDTAMRVGLREVRLMERLAKGQTRATAKGAPPVVPLGNKSA